MMKLVSILTLIAYSIASFGQNAELVEGKAMKFSIERRVDTIEFIVVDTLLEEQKPIFLWCQGSLPIPLFCEIENHGVYFFGGGVSNFNYSAIVEKYHLVIISMPGTPTVAKKENLNGSFHYIPNPKEPGKFSNGYLQADYLDNYVGRAQAVLNYLKKQKWVSQETLVVAGHSQGAKVATKLAGSDSGVTHLGLFAANPFGRIDQYIREARLDAQLGNISWEKADSLMNANYAFYKQAHNEDSVRSNPGLKAWKTFSETYYDDWLELDIPIYLAYGTEDRTADLCDIVPLFFIEKGKNNLTLKRYLGLEHNFFEMNENGRANFEKGHWEDVMNEFISWLE
jgi:pimeloyl-ACP methyl ester carboxylesterase